MSASPRAPILLEGWQGSTGIDGSFPSESVATFDWNRWQGSTGISGNLRAEYAVEIERRYYLVSLPADGVRFSEAVRQHWGVENQLHWVLDVSFAEDASRIRKDQGAQTFSVLRHIALNLLRRESQHKRGIKARRKRAGWDRDYLLQVLIA
jgi:predicted transposase YbfD/YdcC